MCADNGVVEEGVTQTGQEVTAIVAENFLEWDYNLLCDVPAVWCGAFSCGCWNGNGYKSPYRS